MRNPPASEVLNEEIANLLKKKIKASLSSVDGLASHSITPEKLPPNMRKKY
jgi:hypothetical protein